MLLLSCSFNNFSGFITSASTGLGHPEDDADTSKHVGVVTKYCSCICVVHLLVRIINNE
jgi:hypothetical protein